MGFTLAHQTFHQIPRTILSDIFGTVSSQICFRCGDEEASRFAPIFGVKSQDIFNLPKYQAWVRIGINNFLIETYPPKLNEKPSIDFHNVLAAPSEFQLDMEQYNFLEDVWINF